MDNKTLSTHQGLAVVILAAGKGKRMKSALPKVLHPLAGKPLLFHVVTTARSLRPAKIVVVVGYRAEEVQKSLNAKDCSFAMQENPRGTAHAVMQVEQELIDFKGDIVVLSGDVPLIKPETILKLLETHEKNGSVISLISTILDNPTGYGRIIRAGHGNLLNQTVSAIREEKDASGEEKKILEINAGIYCIRKEYLFENLKKIDCNNQQGEYYLTDLIGFAVDDSLPVFCYRTEDSNEVLGINTAEDLKSMENILKNRMIKK